MDRLRSLKPRAVRRLAGLAIAVLLLALQPGLALAATSQPYRPAGWMPCTTSHLKITLDVAGANAAGGSNYVPLNFQNRSRVTCTLRGYPTAYEITRHGKQLGRAATWFADPEPLVTLHPGGYAHTMLQVASVGNFPSDICHMTQAYATRVHPPGDGRTVTLRAGFLACRLAIRSFLQLYPMQPGKSTSGHVPNFPLVPAA